MPVKTMPIETVPDPIQPIPQLLTRIVMTRDFADHLAHWADHDRYLRSWETAEEALRSLVGQPRFQNDIDRKRRMIEMMLQKTERIHLDVVLRVCAVGWLALENTDRISDSGPFPPTEFWVLLSPLFRVWLLDSRDRVWRSYKDMYPICETSGSG